MNKIVSVIVMCHKNDQHVERCLNSIYKQTYDAVELLVINNDSRQQVDHEIATCLSKSPFKVTEYLSQNLTENEVIKNQGLNWAKGEFVLFVDSMNSLEACYIEQLVSFAQEKQVDIVYTNEYNATTNKQIDIPEVKLQSYLMRPLRIESPLIRVEKIQNQLYDVHLNDQKLLDFDFILALLMENKASILKYNPKEEEHRYLNISNSVYNNGFIEDFDYKSYFYILKKYMNSLPLDFKRNVTSVLECLEGTSQETYNSYKGLQRHCTEEMDDQKKELQQLLQKNQYLNELLLLTQNEKQQLLSSKSYKIGNLMIQPLYYAKRVVKNPKELTKIGTKIKMLTNKLPNPYIAILKIIRDIQRKKNNYETPKRMLLFVIYEEQDKLQEYKLYFLEELTKFVDKVFIVVNGSLEQSDINKLSQFGQVETRGNKGYDTAAFRYGIKYLGKEVLSNYDELLLINDTNVGPITDFSTVFKQMSLKKTDFWGISYGEEQEDFTGFNKYGYIPVHLQSYFMVIEKSLLSYQGFYDYWEQLEDTDSRNKAVGRHETIFTKHFENLGFKHSSLAKTTIDSPMYIHPLKMVREGVPLIKYSAFSNDTNDKFAWQGLTRETEIPALIDYIKNQTNYPLTIIEQIMLELKSNKVEEHILIIDGVENAIPQLTTYRVENKKEQLESLGYNVQVVNLSKFQMSDAEHAHTIIIYRAPLNAKLVDLIHLAKKYHKKVFYDIDDLVIDTKYTNQLAYVQQLSENGKQEYNLGVKSYGGMMTLCDGVVTSTSKLQKELYQYKKHVVLNRNLANQELISLSHQSMKQYPSSDEKVKIGYFSGSISHNENFELIKEALIQLLEQHDFLELHLVGHLDLPSEMENYQERIQMHPFVVREKLPQLISQVDINLAPLVDSIFNEAKSEIKWLEAALVKVPTVASNIGAFKDMICDGKTGLLVNDTDWFIKLTQLILSAELREELAINAYKYVMEHAITIGHEDEFTLLLRKEKEKAKNRKI